MKIAILGAPGSHKTQVANSLKRKLEKSPLEDSLAQWKVIDGYVEKLQERTGLPFGHMSTFPHNFTVITDRWVRESEAMMKGYNTITCGSIYESILYATFSTLFTSSVEEIMIYDQLFYKCMMEALGGLEQRTFDYDLMFFLPWTEEQEQELEGTWDAVVNAKIPEVLDGFSKHAVTLRGTDAQKAKTAAQFVGAFWKAAQIATYDQPSVPDGVGESATSKH